MNGETLDEQSHKFHRDAWLAALNGFCSNPECGWDAQELAKESENVAHEAEQLFRNMNQDLPPA